MDNKIVIESKSLLKKELDEIIREGAARILREALEFEIDEFIRHYQSLKTENGKQRVVRNGYHHERILQSKAGGINVKIPRARDRFPENDKIQFSSKIIPPYLRRTRELEEFIPFLYLKGISTNDFTEVLTKMLGTEISLSPSSVVKLKESWHDEYTEWNTRDLSGKQYVYWWVDGIYCNVRMDNDKSCILLIMGATKEGDKELVAVEDGYRESTASWQGVLLDLKKRGLNEGPKLAVGDGSLGFWNALSKEYPKTRHQRCWVHKTANVLDKMPRSVQKEAKRKIHDIYLAPTREDAIEAYDIFVALYDAKYPKAVECLKKNKDETLAFYDFPEEHWRHIRSTNPIESTFATVRLRTHKTKGCGSRKETLTMVFKLVLSASKRWQKIHSHNKISLVMEGKKFVNGLLENAA